MAYKVSRRAGRIWKDVQILDGLIKKHHFNITGKSEREFENSLSSVILSKKDDFAGAPSTQMDQSAKVPPVYFFGKKHRPDIAFEYDRDETGGIAIEIKFINTDLNGIKQAIGQAMVYRIKYNFSFIVLILSKENKDLYNDIILGKEKDLEDIINSLSIEMNIFCYIMPAFSLSPNIKGFIAADL